MSLPPTDPQMLAKAVSAAVAARQQRAAARDALKTGAWDIHRLIDEAQHSDALARMRVKDAVTAFPGLGPARTDALLVGIKIAPDRRIGTLGVRQQERLIAALRDRL